MKRCAGCGKPLTGRLSGCRRRDVCSWPCLHKAEYAIDRRGLKALNAEEGRLRRAALAAQGRPDYQRWMNYLAWRASAGMPLFPKGGDVGLDKCNTVADLIALAKSTEFGSPDRLEVETAVGQALALYGPVLCGGVVLYSALPPRDSIVNAVKVSDPERLPWPPEVSGEGVPPAPRKEIGPFPESKG